MGNKPDKGRKTQQPYNQMVEDAIAALKDRPGSTQTDIFNYLEAKYEGKISPKNKHNLQSVIRSVIHSKKRLRTGMGGRPKGAAGGGTRGRPAGRLRKAGKGRRKIGGVCGGRGGFPRGRARGIMGRPPGKSFKLKLVMPKSLNKTPKSLGKFGKKMLMPRAKGSGGGGGLLRRVKRGGAGRGGGKLALRPARRTTSEGSICLPRMNGRMRTN